MRRIKKKKTVLIVFIIIAVLVCGFLGTLYYITSTVNNYSYDEKTWINNNSNNGFTSSSTSWTISWESVYNYYIRACDGLNNCSSSSLMTIKIDKTAPFFS